MSFWDLHLHIFILAEAVVRGTSAARVLTENALFMNSWRCFSMSSAAFTAMNKSVRIFLRGYLFV
jgi:hypothetical protein